MSTDRNFDGLAKQLTQNIYAQPKGQIRLAILQKDLEEGVAGLNQKGSLKVLDAGVGSGHMAQYIAEKQHQLVACDISETMLAEAQSKITAACPNVQAEFLHCPLQQLPETMNANFDLILCHAVLEWLGEPEAAIKTLLRLLKPAGQLSLMFYNRHAIILHNLLKGNFNKVKSNNFKGHPGGLTPSNPIDPAQVFQSLEAHNMHIEIFSGVRVVHDYIRKDIRNNRSTADLLEMELAFSRQEPYRMMGRYIHLLCRRANSTSEPD